MTSTQMIAKDAYAMLNMTNHRPLRPVAADPKVVRMDALELDGKYDRDDQGLRRSRQGQVGEARMTCQVAVLGGDILLLFWALDGDGDQRRVLVTANGAVYMDTGRGCAVTIGSNNKYFSPAQAILKARAN